MRSAVCVLAVTLVGCYAQDGAYVDGADGARDGALIRGKFFTRTTCAVNAAGAVVCFSGCNEMAYALAHDLTLARRIPVGGAACKGVVDDAGEVHVGDAPMAAAHGVVVTGGRGVSAHGWTRAIGDVRAVGVLPDGGVVAAADELVAFAPDGRERWRVPFAARALAVGPGGEVAATGAQTLLLAPDGRVRARFDARGSSVAIDGQAVYLADGATVARVGGWSRRATASCEVAARIVGLVPDGLMIELAETACEDARDRQQLHYGDDAIETDGAGTLLARVAR